ncbi:molybdopterin-guanine dinucleotide biosynthesis protein B [Chloroflexota bacterium]
MPSIISIISSSKTGKTTLIEKLIKELKSRGYRVATVKHAPEVENLDEPGKDSWRHIQAGSEATVVSSHDKMMLIKPLGSDMNLEKIARVFGEDYDIILAEGFKQDGAPKIEVHRKEVAPPLKDIKKLIAYATDEPLETETRQFSLDDVKGLADLIEEGFIKPNDERLSLYVNDKPVTLSVFPGQIVTNVLKAMASSLKGVGEPKSITVFWKKQE